MGATREIHVRLTGPVDESGVLAALAAHGLDARVDRERSELEVNCSPEREESVLAEVSHTLDDWLVEHGLPFVTARAGRDTLVVRPPAD
jgi:hypothetical protein